MCRARSPWPPTTARRSPPGHIFEGGNVGDWSGSTSFTPPTPGAYILCGWLEARAQAGQATADDFPIKDWQRLKLLRSYGDLLGIKGLRALREMYVRSGGRNDRFLD